MRHRPWVTRLFGGAAQIAGIVYAVLGPHGWDAIVAGLAMVLLGHGLINVRSMSIERLTTAGRLAGAAAAVLLVLGSATAMISHSPSTERPTLLAALREAFSRMLGRPATWNVDAPIVRAINDALPVAAALAMFAILVVIVGPMGDLPEPDDDERHRIATICGAAESDLLAPFTRRHDKRYVYSSDQRAAIGYRVAFGVCVAGAGPVGAPDAHADAMEAFLRRCDERGWRPAMIGASEATRVMAKRMGMHGLQIGDEAIVPVTPVSYTHLTLPTNREV